MLCTSAPNQNIHHSSAPIFCQKGRETEMHTYSCTHTHHTNIHTCTHTHMYTVSIYAEQINISAFHFIHKRQKDQGMRKIKGCLWACAFLCVSYLNEFLLSPFSSEGMQSKYLLLPLSSQFWSGFLKSHFCLGGREGERKGGRDLNDLIHWKLESTNINVIKLC